MTEIEVKQFTEDNDEFFIHELSERGGEYIVHWKKLDSSKHRFLSKDIFHREDQWLQYNDTYGEMTLNNLITQLTTRTDVKGELRYIGEPIDLDEFIEEHFAELL